MISGGGGSSRADEPPAPAGTAAAPANVTNAQPLTTPCEFEWKQFVEWSVFSCGYFYCCFFFFLL